MSFIYFNIEGGNTFQLLNLTSYIMIYITYCDLKVTNGEIDYLLLQQRRRGQFSCSNLTPFIMMDFTCHNYEDKTDQMVYV